MTKLRNFRFCIWLGFILALPGTLLAQNAGSKTLIVNGKTAEGAGVIQIGGRSYVDVETVAQLTNGTFIADPNRVVLTIPVPNAPAVAAAAPARATPAAKNTGETAPAENATTVAAAASPASAAAAAVNAASEAAVPAQPPPGISRGFAGAAIDALADMHEWRGAISAMVTHGLAISDAWAAGYRDQTQADLAKAELATATDADRNALQLLRNEGDNLSTWWDTVLAARQNLNGASTIDPNALKNDTAVSKIRSCGEFLNGMLVSGAFADNSACH